MTILNFTKVLCIFKLGLGLKNVRLYLTKMNVLFHTLIKNL